jgi:ribosomal protein L11 methyltransferase
MPAEPLLLKNVTTLRVSNHRDKAIPNRQIVWNNSVPENEKSPAQWIEISCDIDPLAEEALCSFLFQIGCNGIIQGNFDDPSLKAFIPFEEDFEGVRQKIFLFLTELRHIFPEISPPAVTFTQLKDTDWGIRWKRFFKPELVTPELLIVPAWESVPETQGHKIIRIDPGPAFGTGQHPTTRMCLNAMEKVDPGHPWDMLDVGTGSGILAIYGTILGARKITAIDIDDEAVRWAARNISLNKLTGKIDLSATPLSNLRENFSLVTANLIFKEILEIIQDLSHLTRPMGWLILSGILVDQIPEVEDSLDKHGFSFKHVMKREEWSCIYSRKAAEV